MLDVHPDKGRFRDPVIVYKALSESRPYMIGPYGHPRREAVVLIRLFRKGLDSTTVLSVYDGSHSLTKHEFYQQRAEGKLKARPLLWELNEVLIMRAELWVEFSINADDIFIVKGYSRGIAQTAVGGSEEDVVPFMR